MSERQKGEKLSDYVGRCISARRKEHPEEKQEQSIAACYSMGREHWKAKKKGAPKK
jgi:hypothetical protein